MMFLVPVGGVVDPRFGILTTPGHKGVPAGIKAGLPWAVDNQAFTVGFDAGVFLPWLETMEPYRETCLFVPPPDVVGDACQTLALFEQWWHQFDGWPLAFIAQDGQERLDFPDSVLWGTLFVGGTTHWKLSARAMECIKRAQILGKHIHIGRVNWWRRYAHFRAMEGSDGWTCDGTRTRYDGTRGALAAWGNYQSQLALFGHLPGGDSGG